MVKPLDELKKDENPEIIYVEPRLKENLKLSELSKELKMINTVIAGLLDALRKLLNMFGGCLITPFYPGVIFMSEGRIYAIVTTKNFDIDLVKVAGDIAPIKFVENVMDLNIISDLKYILIEYCSGYFNLSKLDEILNIYKDKIDILTAIFKGLSRYKPGSLKREIESIESEDPIINLLLAYINGEKPSKELIKTCIGKFRNEKNENNKHALFYLLFHFLNPFTT